MVAAMRCVWPQFQWYQLAYATEIKSIQDIDLGARHKADSQKPDDHYVAR